MHAHITSSLYILYANQMHKDTNKYIGKSVAGQRLATTRCATKYAINNRQQSSARLSCNAAQYHTAAALVTNALSVHFLVRILQHISTGCDPKTTQYERQK